VGAGRGGARGGARGARLLKTVIEERSGICPGPAQGVLDRVTAALARARMLGGRDDLTRFAVPIGRGLQHILVDLVMGPRPR
jgi:hypothetical protein